MASQTPVDPLLAAIAFELSPSGLMVVGEDGAILAVNREIERLFGWRREELVGRPVDSLVPDRWREAHPGHRRAFHTAPQARPMGAGRDLLARRKDGSEFPVEIGLNPVRRDDGLLVLATVVDITSRREQERNLRRSQKLEAIGVLAGGIAHDFNNILLGIVGHVELVLREARLGAQSREDLERVLRASERGRELVQRILQFSREDETARKPMRLEHTMGEAIQLLRASLPSTIEIRVELDPGTPGVLSDETLIHQVIMNLGTNAAHAMPGGGVLRIALAPFVAPPAFARTHPGVAPGPYARIVVSDTGAGMSQEVLDRALEPFFTTKPVGQGTGLGLSIVHGIVLAHGGVLEIASPPGEGTTVTVTLPAAPAAGPEPAARAEGAAPTAPRRILLVEDEHTLALMQRRQLEYLGYEVTVHTSSLEALEDFRSRPDAFALLVTDDTMPGMTGRVLAREVMAIRPDFPVLMVSGGERIERAAIEAIGIRGALRKPHTAAELERAIRDVLG